MKNLKYFVVNKNEKIKDAIKAINENGTKTCLVIDEEKKLFGSLTDGDIRRKILRKNKSLKEKIFKHCNKNTKFVYENKFNISKIKKIFLRFNIEIIPVLNLEKRIVDILIRSKFSNIKKKKKYKNNSLLKTDIIVMAGGKGTRLDPITKIFPKPLVPIKNKTALENIMESFLKFGANKFYFLVNYKAELIRAYFKNKFQLNKKITFIQERKFLGTAGGLSKLKKKVRKNIIVTNCDVFFDINFNDLLNYHKINNYDLTIIASNQSSLLPYGVCNVDNNNEFIEIQEKPKFSYLVTTGLYVFNSSILKFVPNNKYLDMNELINLLHSKKKKIGIFKIKQNDWQDIGQLSEYKKNNHLLSV